MSQPPPSTLQPASSQASTSANPNAVVPASYHPSPRPVPIPSFERIDTQAIKQELHDVLGEHGLPYWKTVNGYLLGQVGRAELMEMAKVWFKGDGAHLHNRLLASLLYNASASPGSRLSQLNRKRKRVGPEDADFDIDDTYIEPKGRIRGWASGLSGRDINRIRRQIAGKVGEERPNPDDAIGIEMAKRAWPSFQPVSARQLPSSLQLSHRLAQLCKAYNLNIGADASNDIGDFMAVGMDAHLGDLLHQLVHLTGKERPGTETIRIPKGTKPEPNGMELDDVPIKSEPGEIPKPDLEILQTLFALDPRLHPSASSAVYKLNTSHSIAEAELDRPVKKEEKPTLPSSPSGPTRNGLVAPVVEGVAKQLLDGGLLKLDKGRQSEAAEEGGGKKDKKHSLHWKYEDPAIILKDVLG